MPGFIYLKEPSYKTPQTFPPMRQRFLYLSFAELVIPCGHICSTGYRIMRGRHGRCGEGGRAPAPVRLFLPRPRLCGAFRHAVRLFACSAPAFAFLYQAAPLYGNASACDGPLRRVITEQGGRRRWTWRCTDSAACTRAYMTHLKAQRLAQLSPALLAANYAGIGAARLAPAPPGGRYWLWRAWVDSAAPGLE